jgi:hypothetical protein
MAFMSCSNPPDHPLRLKRILTVHPKPRCGRGRAHWVRRGSLRALRCLQKCLLNCWWKIYKQKVGGGIQIILALVVDDSDILRFGGTLVRQHFVNPARCQQIRIVSSNTNRKPSFGLRSGSHNFQSTKRLTRIFLLPIPCASNQWTSAWRIVPSERRTLAFPLSFRHRPLPYRLRKRGKIRIRVPIAMGSMSVTSPTISKCIRVYYLKHP